MALWLPLLLLPLTCSTTMLRLGLQIFDLETRYIESSNPQGNALKGYEGLLAGAGSGNAKRAALGNDDRVFSGSSVTGRQHVKNYIYY